MASRHTVALADAVASAFALVAGPWLRWLGRYRHQLSRFQAISDRSGFQVRSTHYYEPTYRLADLPEVTEGPRELPGLDLNEAAQIELLSRFEFGAEMDGFPQEAYAHGDAASLYSMIRHFRPRRIIEIGSGHSTRVAIKAIAANRRDRPDYTCEHVCIEPYEMPWLEETGVTVVRSRVEELPLDRFEMLGDGDILFIDSSHIIRPGGDVLHEYQTIVPRLKPGVLVHVHDIFTPRDYPDLWLRTQRRLWNEQYLLEAFLSFNSRFSIVLAVNWLKHTHPAAFERAFPVVRAAPQHEPGAFWFRVNGQ